MEVIHQGYSDDIKVCCTIYDSIYLCVKCDATIIKWLNDTIIPIITKDALKCGSSNNNNSFNILIYLPFFY